MDNSSASQNRKSRRSQVYFSASLKEVGGTHEVKLRNLSAEGALVEGKNLPLEGTDVIFSRKDLNTSGRIVWVNGDHAGIAFEDKLQQEQVLRHVPSPRPPVQPEFRRPGLQCRPLNAVEKKLVESWVWSASPTRPGE